MKGEKCVPKLVHLERLANPSGVPFELVGNGTVGVL
jgi:hypothetical protein